MIACVNMICGSQKHLTLIDADRNKLRTKVFMCDVPENTLLLAAQKSKPTAQYLPAKIGTAK